MTEYINKQKLIKSIEDKRPLNWNDTEAELAEQGVYDDIIDLIKNFDEDLRIVTFEGGEGYTDEQGGKGGRKMNWINVKDRLPDDEEAVLVYYRFDDESKMSFYGTLTYYVDDPYPHWQHEGIGLKVTHWMPLPEPPKEMTESESSKILNNEFFKNRWLNVK